jgi:hypothetical protein
MHVSGEKRPQNGNQQIWRTWLVPPVASTLPDGSWQWR